MLCLDTPLVLDNRHFNLSGEDAFRNQLLQFNSIFDLPWCLIGDFNEIASPGEKKGGLRYPLSKYERLNKFTNTIKASTVPCKGNLFTWKKKLRTYLIYERLDRAIIRNDWMNLYPELLKVHMTIYML